MRHIFSVKWFSLQETEEKNMDKETLDERLDNKNSGLGNDFGWDRCGISANANLQSGQIGAAFVGNVGNAELVEN